MLKVNNIETWYDLIRALHGISFEVKQGDIVALLGSNGAGKSTTLKTIMRLLYDLKEEQPEKGTIEFMGERIDRKNTDEIVRMGISYVPEGREVFPGHATLNKYSDAMVQEQIARGVLAIDSAVAGYRVRTFALPLGVWPKNRALGHAGRWTDPRGKITVEYRFDAILEVTGALSGTAIDSGFNPLSIGRTQVFGEQLAGLLDRIEPSRFVWRGKRAPVTPR